MEDIILSNKMQLLQRYHALSHIVSFVKPQSFVGSMRRRYWQGCRFNRTLRWSL